MCGARRAARLEGRARGEPDGAAAAGGPAAARGGHGRHRPQGHEPCHPSQHARILAGLGWSREIRRMVLPLVRRALAGVAVVTGVVALTFLLLRLAPRGPAGRLPRPAPPPPPAGAP